MNNASLLLILLIAEAAVGYPRGWPHPVQAIGALIRAFEGRFNRGSSARRQGAGIALIVLLVGLAGVVGLSIERVVGQGWGVAFVVVTGTIGLAQRSLDDHAMDIWRPLHAGQLASARIAVAKIVGRDIEGAGEEYIATAAIESLAESFCDGVVAPAFGFLVAGLPGLFAVKAINTADSMVGHRTAELEAFGWASARLDDLINWIPARFAGLLLCLSGTGGFNTMVADAHKHPSPNGGWPEAAIAGVLRRQLGGPVTYDGEPMQRGLLGCGARPRAADLRAAISVYRRACLLLWLAVGSIAWLL